MTKMKKLKLTQLNKNEMEKHEQKSIKGGYYCNCQCGMEGGYVRLEATLDEPGNYYEYPILNY